eukprot:scaffold1003_cov103-Skeletonema_marinoi.AAC.1
MFNALRSASRRRASKLTITSNPVSAANDAISNSSAAAVALLLIALAYERIGNGNDEDAKCGCSNQDNAQAQPQPDTTTSMQQSSFFTNWSSSNAIGSGRPFAPLSAAQCEHSTSRFHLLPDHDLRLQRSVTSKRMSQEAVTRSFFSLYEVDFDNPLGSGAYGDVYLCRDRATGEKYALKKIPKEYTQNAEFQREMNALLHLRANGGHPNICMLKANFDEEDDYLLVFDLVDGGEMFYHLIQHGAYSEADASRLVRQVASALDFCHGIGVVHADLKPENIMLRNYLHQKNRADFEVKLIDFGCSEVLSHPEEHSGTRLPSRKLTHADGATTAYCPPEAFDNDSIDIDPSVDMWALGVIIFTMLLGRHPFDLDCDATDEEIGRRIKEQRRPPLKDCPFDVEISDSAIDLLTRLMEPDPKKRMTAYEMLHHPWVTGETAREEVIEDSVKRLKQVQRYKSGLEKSVIESLLSFSDQDDEDSDVQLEPKDNKRTPLLERAFDNIDKDKKGFLSKKDLKSLPTSQLMRRTTTNRESSREEGDDKMSFTNFSDLVGENLKSVHFPRGHVIYNEDDDGDYVYFINSGTIEVSTKDGFRTKKGQGAYFGKGGILGRKRKTTITCTTPVNVIKMDKTLFEKYIMKGSNIGLKLREKANTERFSRAVSIMNRHGDMFETTYKQGDVIFDNGQVPRDAFIVKEGIIDINAAEHKIYTVKKGRLFGVQSHVLKRNRQAAAVCKTDTCVVQSMPYEKLQALADNYPELQDTLKHLALRQEFRRAMVLQRKKSFPNRDELKEAFDEVDVDRSGTLDAKEIHNLMESLGMAFSDKDL